MQNSMFQITINRENGYLTDIKNVEDENAMNWCAPGGCWGKITWRYAVNEGTIRFRKEELPLLQLDIRKESMIAVYENDKITVTVERFFTENGNFAERFRIKNISHTVVTVNRDNFGIELPFNDRYTYADECMTKRCNTHLWCGHQVTWVCALRMGESDCNLGLYLTQGSVASYSQEGCHTNDRGVFILESDTVLLKSGEEFVLSWELFWHKGKEDFREKISKYTNYIEIKAMHYTVFEDESIEFDIKTSSGYIPHVFVKNQELTVRPKDNGFRVNYTPGQTGEYRFIIQAGGYKTYAEFLVKPLFGDFLKRRIEFIVEHQQCMDPKSPLYGAYLIYDNKTDTMYFDDDIADHNACRERLNMPIVIARYLQFHEDAKVKASMDLYMEFLKREFYNEVTGEVFNTIGKRRDMIRLYNAPGVMLLFAEMYFLTQEEWYIDHMIKLAENYYGIGGKKCYANGIAIDRVLKAFQMSGRKADTEKIFNYFKEHVENMISNGTSYPKHEVNYEQTIVTPAVTCICEMGMFSENKTYYIDEAAKHMECLERFNGFQPSFHLNEISIRFWDDFWFGKSACFGDALPQHLSCLTARAYIAYYRLSGNDKYLKAAEESLRNCMCLVSDEARGSAAYVYPHTLNGRAGEFYDEWANDQDIFFYHAMNCADLIETFRP